MNTIAETFIDSFQFSDNLLPVVTEDLTPEAALKRVRGGEGASLLWTLGHLYEYRRMALERLGVETDAKYQSLFRQAAASGGEGYPELEELLADWERLSGELQDGLSALTNGAFLDEGGEKNSLYRSMVFYTWHEASHLGAVSAMRKEFGYPSASEVVVARMKREREQSDK